MKKLLLLALLFIPLISLSQIRPRPVIVYPSTPVIYNPYIFNRYTPLNPYIPTNPYPYGISGEPVDLNVSIGLKTSLFTELDLPQTIGFMMTLGGNDIDVYLGYDAISTNNTEHFNSQSELDYRYLRYDNASIGLGKHINEYLTPLVTLDAYSFLQYNYYPNDYFRFVETNLNVSVGTFINIKKLRVLAMTSAFKPSTISLGLSYQL